MSILMVVKWLIVLMRPFSVPTISISADPMIKS